MFQTTNQSQINRTVLELLRRWEAVALGKAHPKFVHWWLNTFHKCLVKDCQVGLLEMANNIKN